MSENTVILGTTPGTRLIMDKEFPELEKVDIVPYNIHYSKMLPLWLKLLTDVPRILRVIKKEHEQLKQIVQDHHINLVISDNRFGFHHASVESIYITHQLTIKAGLFSGLASRIHGNYMKRFSKIWVPDFEDSRRSLAGALSANPGLKNVSYIGPLSRLDASTDITESIDYLILLSGAEPQRSVLEEKLCEVFRNTEKKVTLVRGSQKPLQADPGNMRIIDLPEVSLLHGLINAANTIICRSGYSTLMDMHFLRKKHLVLVPTPGQGEQLYLAAYWKERFGATIVTQKQLSSWKP